MKRLRKTPDRLIFGVCGAIGDYFDIDPVLVRIGFLIATIIFGTGILLYLILAIIIPAK